MQHDDADTQYSRAQNKTCETDTKKTWESTGVVPAKTPPKVMPENFSQL